MYESSRAANYTIERFTWMKSEMPYTLEPCKYYLPIIAFDYRLQTEAEKKRVSDICNAELGCSSVCN